MTNQPYNENQQDNGEARYHYEVRGGNPYIDPGHPYAGSERRYANTFGGTGAQTFQFPWWAILIGFCSWWPLGFIFLFLNEVIKRMDKGGTAHGQQGYRTSHAPNYAAQAPQAAPRQSTAPRRTDSQTEEKADRRRATMLMVFGSILAAAGAICCASSIPNLVWGGLMFAISEGLFAGVGLLGGGLAMCLGSHNIHVSLLRRHKIANIVGSADWMYIQDIAGAIPCDEEKCCRYLEACIDKGTFGDAAYLDMRTRTLVVRGKSPAAQQSKAAPASKAKVQPQQDEYQRILQELHTLNDAIPGQEMSDKIDRLEAVSEKIFQQAKDNPNKLPQMHKFMDYYLPTALKLLKTYAELDGQGIEGDNISESKHRIEQAMDTLVVAFEHQLDQLFRGDALDVSTDIDVMENMLAADGLTHASDPFHLYHSASQPAQGEEQTDKER